MYKLLETNILVVSATKLFRCWLRGLAMYLFPGCQWLKMFERNTSCERLSKYYCSVCLYNGVVHVTWNTYMWSITS